MLCISRVVSYLVAALVTVGLVAVNFDLAAQDKKDKKEEAKDKKGDFKDKKEVKKEEKKEPFKPDVPSHEFTYIVKGEKDETGKTFWVTGVAFGPGGKTVAAVYRDNTLKMWDLSAKKDTLSIKAPTIKGLGEYRGLLYAEGRLYIGTGQLIKAPKVKDDPKDKDKDKVKDKAKEPVKERPIRFGEIKIFDAGTGKPGPVLMGHLFNIEALAISKDGKHLATGSDDGTAKIWRPRRRQGHADHQGAHRRRHRRLFQPRRQSNSSPPATTRRCASGTSPTPRKSPSSRSSARSKSRTPRGR